MIRLHSRYGGLARAPLASFGKNMFPSFLLYFSEWILLMVGTLDKGQDPQPVPHFHMSQIQGVAIRPYHYLWSLEIPDVQFPFDQCCGQFLGCLETPLDIALFRKHLRPLCCRIFGNGWLRHQMGNFNVCCQPAFLGLGLHPMETFYSYCLSRALGWLQSKEGIDFH